MRLSKRKLKRMIREEARKVIQEAGSEVEVRVTPYNNYFYDTTDPSNPFHKLDDLAKDFRGQKVSKKTYTFSSQRQAENFKQEVMQQDSKAGFQTTVQPG